MPIHVYAHIGYACYDCNRKSLIAIETNNNGDIVLCRYCLKKLRKKLEVFILKDRDIKKKEESDKTRKKIIE